MKACVLGKLTAVVVWLLVAAVPGLSPKSAFADSCGVDALAFPKQLQAAWRSESRLREAEAAPQMRASGAAAWRAIDVVIELPSEYFYDASGQPIEKSDDQWRDEVRATIAQSNRYLRPLRVSLVPVEIVLHKKRELDPYRAAAEARDAYRMLEIAVSRTEAYHADFRHALLLVLGRRNYSGHYGLAYPATSCISLKYSVAFATIGGYLPLHAYAHAQTIAHEIGHVLGMSHDSAFDVIGANLMVPGFVQHTYGFSPTSLEQARRRIAPGESGASCFRELAAEQFNFAGDSDWDGVSDVLEQEQGSDPSDAGSRSELLSSPVYAFWNSFLGMVNVLELVNPEDKELTVRLFFHALTGELLDTREIVLPALSQFDVIVNDLRGFRADTYGLIRLDFDGRIEGRMSHYRNDPLGGSFDFAYSLPFYMPSFDTAAVSYNTYDAANKKTSQLKRVANWLTIVNLSDDEQVYRIHTFNDRGGVLRVLTTRLPGRGRIDIDGGHGLAAEPTVGLHEIVAENPAAPFTAYLSRYGSTDPGDADGRLRFALALAARHGSGRTTHLLSSAAHGERNWLELINTSARFATVRGELRNPAGDILEVFQLALNPFEQRHLHVSEMLKARGESRGLLTVQSSNPPAAAAGLNRPELLVQGLFYFYDSDGDVSTIYGSPSSEALTGRLTASHNLFLGMVNELKLSNVTSQPLTATLHIAGAAASLAVEIAPGGTTILQLGGSSQFRTAADTYGPIRIESSLEGGLVGELLRLRRFSGEFDIATGTTVR